MLCALLLVVAGCSSNAPSNKSGKPSSNVTTIHATPTPTTSPNPTEIKPLQVHYNLSTLSVLPPGFRKDTPEGFRLVLAVLDFTNPSDRYAMSFSYQDGEVVAGPLVNGQPNFSPLLTQLAITAVGISYASPTPWVSGEEGTKGWNNVLQTYQPVYQTIQSVLWLPPYGTGSIQLAYTVPVTSGNMFQMSVTTASGETKALTPAQGPSRPGLTVVSTSPVEIGKVIYDKTAIDSKSPLIKEQLEDNFGWRHIQINVSNFSNRTVDPRELQAFVLSTASVSHGSDGALNNAQIIPEQSGTIDFFFLMNLRTETSPFFVLRIPGQDQLIVWPLSLNG